MGKIKIEKNLNGIEGLFTITTEVFEDVRGTFSECYNKRDLKEKVGKDIEFVQENHVFSKCGVLRGLHFQKEHPQGKMIRVLKGTIYDVAVDIRPKSTTFGKWYGAVLSDENRVQFFIPEGFAHGFVTLSESSEVSYKLTDYYQPGDEGGIKYNDPELGIKWMLPNGKSENDLIMVDRDKNFESFSSFKKTMEKNMQKKILITGAKGRLGKVLGEQLGKTKHVVYTPKHDELEICDRVEVQRYFERLRPNVVIHAAAFSDVEAAETEREKCERINIDGTLNIVAACKKYKAKLILISTDYVFDGSKNKPYQPDDERCPLNVYGRTKRDAEDVVKDNLTDYAIIRTSWLMDVVGKNFFTTIYEKGKNFKKGNKPIRVVADQIASPTYIKDLALFLAYFVDSGQKGVYHAVNAGECSRYTFAKKMYELIGISAELEPVKTEKYGGVAIRPKYSALDTKKNKACGMYEMPTWEDALTRMIEEL